MLDGWKYWLSATLLDWSIRVLPDDFTRKWMKIGVSIAMEGIQGNAELSFGDDDDEEETMH